MKGFSILTVLGDIIFFDKNGNVEYGRDGYDNLKKYIHYNK